MVSIVSAVGFRERKLPTSKYNECQTTHTVDFSQWKRMCVPISNVHLLDLDKRAADLAFVNFSSAMLCVNIVFPSTITLVDGVCDLNELIDVIAICVEDELGATLYRVQLLSESSFKYYIERHTKRE